MRIKFIAVNKHRQTVTVEKFALLIAYKQYALGIMNHYYGFRIMIIWFHVLFDNEK